MNARERFEGIMRDEVARLRRIAATESNYLHARQFAAQQADGIERRLSSRVPPC